MAAVAPAPVPAPQVNGHASTSIDVPASTTNKIQPNDVGWQFVPQYYNFVNKQPHRLHCFYNKHSSFIHGEEGEDTSPAFGQQEIHKRITAIGYNQCKVYIHSIDSQSSANGGIIILVIGEMSNNLGPWRKFTQTFFLAEQPNGYFVLNDIFRYLKEDVDEDEDEPAEDEPAVQEALPVEVPAPTAAASEIINSPARPDPSAVPEEAIVAAVPDKDIAPSEPPAIADEPVPAAPAPVEERAPTPTPAPAPTPSAPAPAAAAQAPVLPNGTAAPSTAPPTTAPSAPPKPAAPKSWASMAAAASGRPAWGAPAPAVTAAPAAVAKKEEAPAAAAAPAATPAASAPAPSGSTGPRHAFYDNAMRVQTPHCFVKLPNWSAENQGAAPHGETIDEATLKTAASRFGEVAKVEIVKFKACAFVEFKSVESARKAIIASLPVSQGGEGGVKVGSEGGKLNFETRKEKDERRPKAQGQGQGQGQGQAQGGGQGAGAPAGQAGRGGATGGAERGGRGGRGGSGAGGQGGRDGFEQPNGGERGQGSVRGRGRGRGGAAAAGGERPVAQKQ